MKRILFSILVTMLFSVAFLACDDDTSCNISTATYTNTNAGTVTYTASVTGDSRINLIRYGSPVGEVIVNDPLVPYGNILNVPAGTNLFIAVSGGTSNGDINFGLQFTDGASEMFQDLRECN